MVTVTAQLEAVRVQALGPFASEVSESSLLTRDSEVAAAAAQARRRAGVALRLGRWLLGPSNPPSPGARLNNSLPVLIRLALTVTEHVIIHPTAADS